MRATQRARAVRVEWRRGNVEVPAARLDRILRLPGWRASSLGLRRREALRGCSGVRVLASLLAVDDVDEWLYSFAVQVDAEKTTREVEEGAREVGRVLRGLGYRRHRLAKATWWTSELMTLREALRHRRRLDEEIFAR